MSTKNICETQARTNRELAGLGEPESTSESRVESGLGFRLMKIHGSADVGSQGSALVSRISAETRTGGGALRELRCTIDRRKPLLQFAVVFLAALGTPEQNIEGRNA
jgi:hypothetical protein